MYFFQQAIDRSQEPQESVTDPITIRTSAGAHSYRHNILYNNYTVCVLAKCTVMVYLYH